MQVRGASAGAVAALSAMLGAGGLLTGCGGAGTTLGNTTGHPAEARLVAFDSCPQLLDQVRAQALTEVTPYGLATTGSNVHGFTQGGMRYALDAPQAVASAAPSAGAAQSATGSGTDGSSPSFSSTNVQETGVDEPDLAKTDGNLLVALHRDGPSLEVADAGSAPRLRGSLSLGDIVEPSGLFLLGSDAVVLGSGPQPTPVPQPLSGSSSSSDGLTMPVEQYTPTTVVAVVSLADPDHPSVTRTFTVQGDEVDARVIAGRIEVVVTSAPNLPFVAPTNGSSSAQAEALAENKAVIQASQPADWLPSVTSSPGDTTQTTACTAAMHPAVASGLDTVSVVPIDPSAAQPGPEATVVGDATTVYASATSLYVATTAWTAPTSPPVPMGISSPAASVGSAAGGAASSGSAQAGVAQADGPAIVSPPSDPAAASTDIHGFDLSDPGAPRYLGSAEVPGSLIGQYALSEYQGYLRVATTVGSATPPPNEGVAPTTASDNRVTILQPQGGSLATVSTVSGLGSGEKIYAVRFIGPLGYVVTFRQTDPLYVLDLHDPQNPQLAGQLALTGYSSFLQPLSGNLLLGVGQEVDANLRRTGLQVSLFDVSDPGHPQLLSKDVLEGANSSAESDPHALLYWAPAQRAVMPVTQESMTPVDGSTAPAPVSPFDGAVAFRVANGSVSEAGRVSQPVSSPVASPGPVPMGVMSSGGLAAPGAIAMPYAYGTTIERALVVGSMLYTVSESGIMVSDLGSFAPVAWMAYSS